MSHISPSSSFSEEVPPLLTVVVGVVGADILSHVEIERKEGYIISDIHVHVYTYNLNVRVCKVHVQGIHDPHLPLCLVAISPARAQLLPPAAWATAAFLAWDSLHLPDCYIACGEGEYGGTDISCYHATQCDVGVSLHSSTHPLFMHVAQ